MSEDRLRPLLDVTALDATEERLRDALAAETTDAGRAEVVTQLARVEMWRGRLDTAHSLLDQANGLAGNDGVANARILLERGRVVRRSDGDGVALPLLEQAFEAALAAGQHFMAADAAHACALAGDMVASTERGLEVADKYEAACYWRGTLLINLGEWQWERGAYEDSLSTFRAALEACEQEPRNPFLTEHARHGLARALRSLGRSPEALPLLERAVRWAEENSLRGPEADELFDELAAAYEDIGRTADATTVRMARATRARSTG
jgi:tetratricopeptide (TPR) repeat protein